MAADEYQAYYGKNVILLVDGRGGYPSGSTSWDANISPSITGKVTTDESENLLGLEKVCSTIPAARGEFRVAKINKKYIIAVFEGKKTN